MNCKLIKNKVLSTYPKVYLCRIVDLDSIIDSVSEFSFTFTISESPFSNCQSFTIGNFISLFNRVNKDDLKEIIYKLQEITGRPQFVIDIRSGLLNKVIESLKDYTTIQAMNYTSTNGSEMTLCLIQLKKQ
jgi:hypothetical protein